MTNTAPVSANFDMTPADIEALFSTNDGAYRFARWQRPIVPIVFGVDDATLPVIKGALEAVVGLAGHEMSDMDVEFGANLMVFFLRDWHELAGVPDLGELIPDLPTLIDRLAASDATQYRLFRFETNGAIKAGFSFIRMAGPMADIPASDIALADAVQMVLMWGDGAFGAKSPLAKLPDSDVPVLRPEIAAVIRAAYDPKMPLAANDAAHAIRLFARAGLV